MLLHLLCKGKDYPQKRLIEAFLEDQSSKQKNTNKVKQGGKTGQIPSAVQTTLLLQNSKREFTDMEDK